MLELLRAGAGGKNVVLGPAAWLVRPSARRQPAVRAALDCGVVRLAMRWPRTVRGRGRVPLFADLMVLHAKDYYLAGIYPLLFAAGGVACERIIPTSARARVRGTGDGRHAGAFAAGTAVAARRGLQNVRRNVTANAGVGIPEGCILKAQP